MGTSWRGRFLEGLSSVAFVLTINLVVRTFFKGLVDDLIRVTVLRYLQDWERTPVVGLFALGVEWIVVAAIFVIGPIFILGPPLLIVGATWAILFHERRPRGVIGWLGFITLYLFALAGILVLGIIGISYCERWGTC